VLKTDNYFRCGRNVYFFSSKDLLAVHRAWNAARAASEASATLLDGRRIPADLIAVYRPFGLDGPWWNTDVIGFMPAGDRPDGDIMEAGVIDSWIERTELRKLLWATGAWHVNTQGAPTGG
jgi:hypothetical protein